MNSLSAQPVVSEFIAPAGVRFEGYQIMTANKSINDMTVEELRAWIASLERMAVGTYWEYANNIQDRIDDAQSVLDAKLSA